MILTLNYLGVDYYIKFLNIEKLTVFKTLKSLVKCGCTKCSYKELRTIAENKCPTCKLPFTTYLLELSRKGYHLEQIGGVVSKMYMMDGYMKLEDIYEFLKFSVFFFDKNVRYSYTETYLPGFNTAIRFTDLYGDNRAVYRIKW